jgi:hypothetical protein
VPQRVLWSLFLPSLVLSVGQVSASFSAIDSEVK